MSVKRSNPIKIQMKRSEMLQVFEENFSEDEIYSEQLNALLHYGCTDI